MRIKKMMTFSLFKFILAPSSPAFVPREEQMLAAQRKTPEFSKLQEDKLKQPGLHEAGLPNP